MTPAHRPRIEPVSDSAARPLWSVMIPTYECAEYLGSALESVLGQDPGPEKMQIEVVDDASTDDPASVVRAYGSRVGFHQQPANVGHHANLNTCLARARGRLVHVLHGDDAVRDGFYAKLEQPFADPEVGAAFCRFIVIDESGHWMTVSPLEAERDGLLDDWLEKLALGQRLQAPTMVVRRALYEQLGGFDDRAGDAEDWEMWTRVAAHTRVWHSVEPLALYRIRSTSLSRGSLRTGEHVDSLRRVVELNRAVLPPERRDELTSEARHVIALTALQRSRRYLSSGDNAAARAQLREALRTSRSPTVLERAFVLALVAGRARVLRGFRTLRSGFKRKPG